MGAVGSFEVSIRNNPEMRTCILIILVASLLADIALGCKKDKPCYDYGMKKYDKACKCKDAKYNYKHKKYCGHYETLGSGCQTIDARFPGNITIQALDRTKSTVVVPWSKGSILS